MTDNASKPLRMWCWWKMLLIPWTKKASNKFILSCLADPTPLDGQIIRQKMTYFGHVIQSSQMEKNIEVWCRVQAFVLAVLRTHLTAAPHAHHYHHSFITFRALFLCYRRIYTCSSWYFEYSIWSLWIFAHKYMHTKYIFHCIVSA